MTISGTENIVDTTPPVVTLIGSSTLTLFSGSVYADSGAVWSDNIDGSGTALVGTYGATGSFQSSGSVNTTLTGTYTIEYLKVDAAGNSGTVSRTVNVVPIITLNTNITGTGTATISIGAIQPGTLVVTSGSTINTTSTNGSLTIPGTVDFTLSGSVWNGILYAPAVSTGSTLDIGDASVVSNLPQDTSTTNYSYTVLQTLMA